MPATYPSHLGALRRALAVTASHPQVASVTSLRTTDGTTKLELTFDVNLPSESKRKGETPSGVRLKEPVRFDFPRDYPRQAPSPSVRADFSRAHPHLQPWLNDGRPVPCIYEGELTELFHAEGFAAILDQTALWLDRAAAGTLIDPAQGWEPVRRDSYDDFLEVDARHVRGLANRSRPYRFLALTYVELDGGHVFGRVSRTAVSVNQRTMPSAFKRAPGGFHSSLVLVARPGTDCSGSPIVSDTYLPESVTSVGDLRVRAAQYGNAQELDNALTELKLHFTTLRPRGPFTLAVVLLNRRPFHLIGSDSPIELRPYVVDVATPDLFAQGDATPVRPAAHLDILTRRQLVQMSGGDETATAQRWTLIGAGSLGSKIAIHLGRAGHGPDVVVDKASMAPHNAARHALMPGLGNKAALLCDALRELDHSARPVVADAASPEAFKRERTWSSNSWAVVNATASLGVHEAIAAAHSMPIRVIEVSLFAGGSVGIITVEGPNRNPGANDLIGEFYAKLKDDHTLASILHVSDDAMSRQPIGQGCGSLTMPMSDGRVSLFAAGMAEYLLTKQSDGLPRTGELLIGRLSDNGVGLRWDVSPVNPVTVVSADLQDEPWRIHIHPRADLRIREESTRCRGVETGGVLMGRISEVSRTVHVLDVVDAPEDSVRRAAEFTLGTQGLQRAIENYSNAVNGSLYCLGTWHSHPAGGAPSAADRTTAKAVALARLVPSVFLLLECDTDTYTAILADAGEIVFAGKAPGAC